MFGWFTNGHSKPSVGEGKIIAHALFDGIKWNYVKDHDDVSDMLTYELVDTTGAIIPLQLENKKAKKFLVRINPDIEQSHAMALQLVLLQWLGIL